MERETFKRMAFKSLGKLLHEISTENLSSREFREELLRYSETDDIIMLIEALDDLLAQTKKE
jgi:hypothetical protein